MTDRMINETRITVRGVGGGGGAGEVTVSVSSRPRARGRSPARPAAIAHRLQALQLPPIICSVSPGSSDASPRSGRSREWREGGQSRYHRACCDRAPAAPAPAAGAASAGTPRGVPAPRRTGPVVDEAAVVAFLESRSQFLDQYVAERVELSVLERWLVRKTKDSPTSKTSRSSLSRWELCAHADKRDMLQNMMESLKAQPSKETVVWELARCVSAAVGVDGCVVYELDRFEPENVFVYCGGDSAECVPAQEKRLAVQAAQLCRPLRLARSTDLCDFPQGICTDPGAEYVMYQPVVEAGGDSAVVVELWRREQPFTPEDDEVCAAYLAWGGIALHHAQLYLNMDKQKHLSDFLLDVVKSIFQDMISMEAVVTKVMTFAQKLVHADRASLFLVDPDTDELYATVFDVGVEDSSAGDAKAASGSEASAPKSNVKEIRFPIGTGIAGHVAKTGEVLNITDAYEDDRFNRTVDNLTGYKTKTILCMPIYIRNAIIGVVQMVNKKSGPFTSVDERAFEMFAVYCGLALHHAKLYDHIRRSQQKYKVALDVLSYHSTCTDEEVRTLLKLDVCSRDVGLDSFYFSPFACAEYEKVVHAIYMFNDLFSKSLSFDHMSVVKFVLTVKKNYRRVPYHNWTHGFAVANCMFNIVRHTNAFSRIEKLALFTGALCHDLDHRGKNNKYMLDTESPLAAMYSTSTLEHHHFNQTITILQQDGHNIISQLSSAEYKQVLTLLKRCILATDLAAFFPNRARLAQLINDDQFDWHKREHRMLVLAMSMTASDLSASAKPWAVQVETVKVIFQEFYEQGDAERAHGRPSLPMMDRNRPEDQADSQVGFLKSICVPCYSLLSGLLPQTLPLLRMCEENLARWEDVDRQVKAELAAGRLPTHLYIAIDRDQ